MQSINLENLKASGVYTFEYDASQTLSETTEYGRLLIGSSKTGPFNTVVRLANDAQKRSIFGSNDRQLEKYGSFFHKAIEISLSEGPVYAMNVLPIDTSTEDNKDLGSVTTFNTDSATNISGDNIATPVMYMFDRQKFWKYSEEAILRAKNGVVGNWPELKNHEENVLLFTNASQRTVTIFVMKSNITGYDLTVSEWYKSQTEDDYIPTFLSDDDLISDYMVNVVAVVGDWTNYKKLASDTTYGRYFDRTGLRKDRIAEFLQLKTVSVLVNVTGSLIPDFKDDRGSIISIDKLFNMYYPSTQLMCAIDADSINKFDPNNTTQYNPGVDPESIKTHRIDLIGHGLGTGEDSDEKLINTISYRGPVKGTYKVYTKSDITDLGNVTIKADENSYLYKVWEAGYFNNGDKIVKTIDEDEEATSTPTTAYVKIEYFEVAKGQEIEKYITITPYWDKDFSQIVDAGEGDEFLNIGKEYTITFASVGGYDVYKAFDIPKEVEDGSGNPHKAFFYDESVPNEIKINVTYNINDQYEQDLKRVKKGELDEASPYTGWVVEFVKYVKVNNYLKAKTEGCEPRYLKIMSVSRITDPETKESFLVVKTMAPVGEKVYGIGIQDGEQNVTVVASKGIHQFTNSVVGKIMSPFKISENLLPNGTPERIDTILKYLTEDSNLASAITESEEVDIRYIVDTYEGEITSNSKYRLSYLAATHGKCMAFVNAPSMKQFEQSTDPKFIDMTTGLLNTEYIATGGNLDLNPSFVYKFGSDTVRGMPIETFCIPCIPYLIINDGGIKRSMIPAPYVCNAYMRKFKMNAPFVIIAGVNTGKLTEREILGVEYEFTKSDREWLEPAGYNVIIQRRRDGVMLFANNTAYQSVKSALNNAHVRDTLITLEKRIEKILFSFLFRYNTEVVRSRVKSLVDNYLETVKLAGGVASYETQIDGVNNDQYVLENNSAILDIKVDFPRGIHKFVNRVTITRVGGELSVVQSGFSDL